MPPIPPTRETAEGPPRNDTFAPAGPIPDNCITCPLCQTRKSHSWIRIFQHMQTVHRLKIPPFFVGDAVEELDAEFMGLTINERTREVESTCFKFDMRKYERKERRRRWLRNTKRFFSKALMKCTRLRSQ